MAKKADTKKGKTKKATAKKSKAKKADAKKGKTKKADSKKGKALKGEAKKGKHKKADAKKGKTKKVDGKKGQTKEGDGKKGDAKNGKTRKGKAKKAKKKKGKTKKDDAEKGNGKKGNSKKGKAKKGEVKKGVVTVSGTKKGVKKLDPSAYDKDGNLKKKVYEGELARLQEELVKQQYWIKDRGLKVCVIFEGRDAAGKGGVIKRITQRLNPRIVRVVALATPTEREAKQWYFQRYAPHLPAAGEMVLFDRSWYNRAGVERVMGFCSDDDYREFMRSCPEFERMLVRSGIVLIKYWFSISDEEQERRFQQRNHDPMRRWKLSPMDVVSRSRWVDYSRAKDSMLMYTDIEEARWYVVNADVKRHARLNCISHLLNLIPYEDLTPEPIELPARQSDTGYQRPPITDQVWVSAVYGENPPGALVG
jgi:polyphosphate kinase 2